MLPVSPLLKIYNFFCNHISVLFPLRYSSLVSTIVYTTIPQGIERPQISNGTDKVFRGYIVKCITKRCCQIVRSTEIRMRSEAGVSVHTVARRKIKPVSGKRSKCPLGVPRTSVLRIFVALSTTPSLVILSAK